MKNRKKQTVALLRSKMVDFKYFAITLLCVGSFFYLGTILPSGDKAIIDTYVYMGATITFLGISIVFFSLSKKYKRILAEMDDQDSLKQ
ncbi:MULTISPECIES: YrhC family protein [Peribacillus]|uniref:YrhC family protein n=1 Tax=Peribacillus TaxID=2675229 RepID=UPI001F4EA7DD|nr:MULTISPECIES: YrhC family protein [unclassified Peribacillus]MCK1982072.1 YrhC family protein [Peribacillus sp. Aquil_B1]MCK2007576.1 YrhC family protein [Peribacillus sp. Aquil_B8]